MDNILANWANTPASQLLQRVETRCLETILPSLRGFHLLLLGTHRHLIDLPKHYLHALQLSPTESKAYPSYVQAQYEQLPFREASIDAAIITYLMEYLENPVQLLSELFRALAPKGKLFLFTFHRWHPWCWQYAPKSIQAISDWRLKKLVLEAGFTIYQTRWLYYGAIGFIEIHKQLATATPLKPCWQPIPDIKHPLTQPTARQIRDNLHE